MLRQAIETVKSTVDRAREGGAAHPSDEPALRERVRLFDQLAGLAATGLADTVKQLDDIGGIEHDGASSTAEWIKATTNRSGRSAARLARLATDLGDLPATRDALASGRITDEAADAVVRAARDGRLGSLDEVDGTLAGVAESSTPEDLRADIRDRQQAVDAAAMLRDENRQHARRSLRLWRKRTGMWGTSGELPDELGQTFRTALDAFERPDPAGTPPGQGRRPEQRLADALAAMTQVVLDRGLAPGSGGITRPHLSVIVAAEAVSADLARPDVADPDDPSAAPAPDDPRWADLPGGELAWGGKLSPQAVRRICCDAAVSRIVLAGSSQVLDVGRATRHWSGPQRRAVNARDRGCRGPHCDRPIAWTSIHHLQWWRHDGPTSVDNGLALCHRCHHRVHDQGWTVELDLEAAAATWTSPTGTVVVTNPRTAGAAGPSPSTSDTPMACFQEDSAVMLVDEDPHGHDMAAPPMPHPATASDQDSDLALVCAGNPSPTVGRRSLAGPPTAAAPTSPCSCRPVANCTSGDGSPIARDARGPPAHRGRRDQPTRGGATDSLPDDRRSHRRPQVSGQGVGRSPDRCARSS